MNIGFLGLGKLGLPVALAVEDKGHKVFGYDISNTVKSFVKLKKIPYKEVEAPKLLKKSKLKLLSIKNLVSKSEIIFVPIQTPHNKKYEGITAIPKKRVDFDYKFLKNGIKQLANEIQKQKKNKVVIIISTVLPGTISREIKPLLNKYVKLCYNPFFIAMGTTINDFLNPEIILFGVDDKHAAKKAEKFYKTINNSPFFKTSIENAELIKVCYNTFISTKIAFINTIMELCHNLPNTNVDEVSRALSKCKGRIISDKYLSGGMGDGGGCHPRDNIALSWLARKKNLSMDWFEATMLQREKQTIWLTKLIKDNLPKNKKVYILGKTFKPETNIITGSPSVLLGNFMKSKNIKFKYYDPFLDKKKPKFKSGLYFIGTRHIQFKKFKFPKGSTVIDPFRYIPKNTKINLISLGKN
tara:strand:- start:1769 stop:3004 length:1236 start_codon:yes stop_codon:yes gene_type:complete